MEMCKSVSSPHVADTKLLDMLADDTWLDMPPTDARRHRSAVTRVVCMAQDRPDLDVVACTLAKDGTSQDWRRMAGEESMSVHKSPRSRSPSSAEFKPVSLSALVKVSRTRKVGGCTLMISLRRREFARDAASGQWACDQFRPSRGA